MSRGGLMPPDTTDCLEESKLICAGCKLCCQVTSFVRSLFLRPDTVTLHGCEGAGVFQR